MTGENADEVARFVERNEIEWNVQNVVIRKGESRVEYTKGENDDEVAQFVERNEIEWNSSESEDFILFHERNKRANTHGFFFLLAVYTPNFLLFEGESRVECTALTGVSVYLIYEKRD